MTLKNHDFAIQNIIIWHNKGVLHIIKLTVIHHDCAFGKDMKIINLCKINSDWWRNWERVENLRSTICNDGGSFDISFTTLINLILLYFFFFLFPEHFFFSYPVLVIATCYNNYAIYFLLGQGPFGIYMSHEGLYVKIRIY